MLFGGPVGALVAGITALFEEASGNNSGEHIADLINDFTGGRDGGGATPNVAAGIADTPKDTLAGAQAGLNAGTQTGAAVQQAVALAGSPIAVTAIARVAAQLNRIPRLQPRMRQPLRLNTRCSRPATHRPDGTRKPWIRPLNRYRNGANAGVGGTPAISLHR
jgi:hypothetical protein